MTPCTEQRHSFHFPAFCTDTCLKGPHLCSQCTYTASHTHSFHIRNSQSSVACWLMCVLKLKRDKLICLLRNDSCTRELHKNSEVGHVLRWCAVRCMLRKKTKLKKLKFYVHKLYIIYIGYIITA